MRIWVFIAAMIFAAPAFAQNTPVGTVSNLQGPATVTRGNASQPLALNAPIFLNDILETGPGAKLLVTFNDNTQFRCRHRKRSHIG